MEISAITIEGEVHARLSALENFYGDVASAGDTLPYDEYHKEAMSVARILKRLQELRLHFNCLRQRHNKAIRMALAGEDSLIQLDYQEAVLVDTIRELHDNVWALRRSEASAAESA